MTSNNNAGAGTEGRLLRAVFSRMSQPSSIKAGGYPDDMFYSLSSEERQQYECLICFMILRDPRQCNHGHNFCSSCVYAWTLSGRACSSQCPVCRTPGQYRINRDLSEKLGQKQVKCKMDRCQWKGKLKDHKSHNHTYATNMTRTSEGECEFPHIINSSSINTNHAQNSVSEGGTFSPRSHEEQIVVTRRGRPNLTHLRNQLQDGRERLQNLMGSFSERLQERRARIQSLQRERESLRVEQLREVEDLGQRLGDVAYNLMRLLDGMNTDSTRYRTYIENNNATQRALESIIHEHPEESAGESSSSTPRPSVGELGTSSNNNSGASIVNSVSNSVSLHRPRRQMVDLTLNPSPRISSRNNNRV